MHQLLEFVTLSPQQNSGDNIMQGITWILCGLAIVFVTGSIVSWRAKKNLHDDDNDWNGM